jgi:TolB-like protein/tetratricopeptide (TPR) repeat protein
MNLSSLFAELKRRRVFRVTGIYAIVAWLVVQVAATTFPVMMLPEWTVRFIIALFLLGIPVVVVLAWMFDVTPEGIERTGAPATGGEPAAGRAGRRAGSVPAWVLGVLLVAAAATGFYRYAPHELVRPDGGTAIGPATAELDRSVAVLPFADFSPGGDQEWFSDGLAEEILNALARLPDLRVASRTAAFAFRGHNGDIGIVAGSLGVGHVLEGSVRRSGDRLRITAQLIRASDGARVWSQNFDRGATDVIQVQEEIAFEIARTMRTALDPEALRRMLAAGTNSVAAHQAYLRGQHIGRASVGGPSHLDALAAFEEARALDPQFSDAHRAAALFWVNQLTPVRITYGLTDLPYAERERLADERLGAAVATATDEVRRVRAEAPRTLIQLRLREALHLSRRAVELQPLEHEPWRDLAELALPLGDHGLAASAFRRAAELADNEAEVLSRIMNRSHRVDLDGALVLVERALALDPHSPDALYNGHRVLLWAGRTREAAALAERFRAVAGSSLFLPIVQLRQACAEGRTADALAAFASLERDGRISSRWLGRMYLGRTAEATELLRPMDEAGELYALLGFLEYTFFDAAPLANLSEMLRREGIVRPPPAPIPYACSPAQPAVTPPARRD